MAGIRALLPVRDDLMQLPRWAVVAFSARCARRVQPLYAAWPGAFAEDSAAIDHAIAVVEAAARSGRSDDRVLEKARAQAASADVAAVRASARSAAAAATAAFASVSAARSSASHATAFAQFAERVVSASHVAIVEGASNSAHGVDWNVAGHFHSEALWHDYDSLSALASEGKWTNEWPVDPDLLGPLWPKGEPSWWPKQSTQHDLDLPSVVLEFTVSPDVDQEEIDIKIAELLGHLSQLQHAYGGSGLVIRDGLAFEPVRVEAPCGPSGGGGGDA